MKKAKIFVNDIFAGTLVEKEKGRKYIFTYGENFQGPSVSLTMPVSQRIYEFDRFPPFFEGLLPEGMMLESLLKRAKIDRDDLFKQLVTVGDDLVGNVTVEEIS